MCGVVPGGWVECREGACCSCVGMGDEYDPFEDAEQDAEPASAAGDAETAPGRGGGEGDAPAAEKIVMKLDAGKKKAKVAAVFDVGHTRRVPRVAPAALLPLL